MDWHPWLKAVGLVLTVIGFLLTWKIDWEAKLSWRVLRPFILVALGILLLKFG